MANFIGILGDFVKEKALNRRIDAIAALKKIAQVLLFCLVAQCVHAQTMPQWQPKVAMESLFPSYIISTATLKTEEMFKTPSENYLGDINGQIGFEVVAPSNECSFIAEVSSTKYIRKSVLRGTMKCMGQKYRIYPKIEYDYDAMYTVLESVPETITFSLSLDGKTQETMQQTVQVRSLHDCVFALTKPDGKVVPCTWMFAAYVNENHPLVERILKSALDHKLVDKFAGYQLGKQHVYDQIFAIWNVLQRQGIKYSNITTPSVGSDRVFSQHVRFLSDSVANTQANCVDGSVLFASVFRKIGLQSFLVIVPGHCFVGCLVQENPRQTLFIETTMIGNDDLKKLSFDRGLNALASRRNNNLSRTSFEKAYVAGAKEIEKASPHFGKTPGYFLIDLDKARAKGIQPLKSVNK